MLGTIAQRLREVTVRPTVGARERQRWDELMSAHHYLSAGQWLTDSPPLCAKGPLRP